MPNHASQDVRTHRLRPRALAGVVVLATLCATTGLPAAVADPPENQACTTSDGITMRCLYEVEGEGLFTVPEGVTSLDVDARGGDGDFSRSRDGVGDYTGGPGGLGAEVRANLDVRGIGRLYVEVGGRGTYEQGGFNGGGTGGTGGPGTTDREGGGGGGASDVRTVPRGDTATEASRLLVAAGGGGGAAGGGCVSNLGPPYPANGGAGGDGGASGTGSGCALTSPENGGQAGAANGPNGEDASGGGGAGGGGLAGGTAGGTSPPGAGGSGGGGGGSNLVPDRGVVSVYGGDAYVAIYYRIPTADRLVLAPSVASAKAGAGTSFTAHSFSGSTDLGDVSNGSTFSITPAQGGSATGALCTGNTCSATAAGTYTVSVRNNGLSATATLTVTAAPPATVAVSSGSGQSAAAGTTFASPLVVTVADAYGNPVPGAPVTYAVAAGSARLGSGTSVVTTTSTDGTASATLVAGTSAGPVTVTANAGGSGAAFIETVTAGGPARADLTVTTSAPSVVRSGSSGSLVLTVHNNGPSASGAYTAALALPRQFSVSQTGGGTRYGTVVAFRGTDLASGASATYTVVITARGSGTVRYAALAFATTTDPRPANNVVLRSVSIG